MEFVNLADMLSKKSDEAALRTAISRAYYAVYHTTTETVRMRMTIRPRGHRIWEQLQDIGVAEGRPDLRDIGLGGRELKRRREQADYHSPFDRDNRRQTPIDELTQDTLVLARQLLHLLETL